MTIYTKAQMITGCAAAYPDNSLGQITPSTHRTFLDDLMDSVSWPSNFATVAFSGAYSDLSGLPSIPAAQVQSDWSAVSGLGVILNKPVIPSVSRVVSTFSASIVTSTSAGGVQVSSTKDSSVRASVQIVTTASIGGNQSGTIIAEVAPTNSTTAGDWVKYGEFTNGQALTLAITLQSVQTMAGQLCVDIPAGYWVRFRSINNSGTPSYAYQSGQKTIYG